MKVHTPEISWHGRDPIYSIDSHFIEGDIHRIATCGADTHVRIWQIKQRKDKVDIEILATLTRHNKTVNVVRFSPNGEYLASAGDDSVIILWQLNTTTAHKPNLFQDDDDTENKENWTVAKHLRSHLEDVYDLSWSANSKFLVSGSVDNSAIIWDVQKGSRVTILPDHKSFVQGVAYDPLEQFVATMSSDRSCRIFSVTSKNCLHNIYKGPPLIKSNGEKAKCSRLFHDDTMKSFFRRLTFSPDGLLLIVPAGTYIVENGDKEEKANTVYIFGRHSLQKPILHLPGHGKAALAVRCSPLLYELRKIPKKDAPKADTISSSEKPWEIYETILALPYRMVFAVATEDSVILYDTQQPIPFATLGNIHYHTLSDIAWSQDGRTLLISSTDGYCSVVSFEENEIGIPLEDQLLKVNNLENIRLMNCQSKTKKGKNKNRRSQIQNTSLNTSPKPSSSERSQIQNTSLNTSPKPSSSESVLNESKNCEALNNSAVMSSPCIQKADVESSPSISQKSPFVENTKQPRRINVTTLISADDDTKSSAASSVLASPLPPSPVLSPPRQKTPRRRIQVTTLETYASNSSTSEVAPALQNCADEEEDESLNLVLECDNTMDVDDTPAPDKSKSETPSKSSDKKAPRRITVETLQSL